MVCAPLRTLLALSACLAASVCVAQTTSQPQSLPSRLSPPTAIPKVIADALLFSPAQRRLIDAVSDDRLDPAFDPAVLLLLGRVAQIPPLADPGLESPSVRILRKHPGDFRLLPVKMELRVYVVKKLLPGDNALVTPDWPKDKPLWQISAVNTASPDPKDSPVILFSPTDPTSALLGGRPVQSNEQSGNTIAFDPPGRTVTAYGIFYRLYRTGDLAGQLADFPVLLAWRLDGGDPQNAGQSLPDFMLGPIGIVTAAVLLIFFFMWRLGKWQGARRQEQTERSRRLRQRALHAPETTGDEINPALKQAAEDYLKERSDDGKKHTS